MKEVHLCKKKAIKIYTDLKFMVFFVSFQLFLLKCLHIFLSIFYGRSTPVGDDIAPPFEGEFFFANKEGGSKEILVRVLPASGEQESEDTFTIVLEDAEPAEVSQDNGNVTITVRKKVRLLLNSSATLFSGLERHFMVAMIAGS